MGFGDGPRERARERSNWALKISKYTNDHNYLHTGSSIPREREGEGISRRADQPSRRRKRAALSRDLKLWASFVAAVVAETVDCAADCPLDRGRFTHVFSKAPSQNRRIVSRAPPADTLQVFLCSGLPLRVVQYATWGWKCHVVSVYTRSTCSHESRSQMGRTIVLFASVSASPCDPTHLCVYLLKVWSVPPPHPRFVRYAARPVKG